MKSFTKLLQEASVKFNVLKGNAAKSASDGTGRVGTLKNVNRAQIIKKLGEPSITGSIQGKTQNEWVIKFGTYSIANIYDYKEDKPVDKITEWSVGGNSKDSLGLIDAIFKGKATSYP